MKRVALITGASRGLGKTVASFLAAQGYDLILTARGAEALVETTAELQRYGGQIVALPGDVSDGAHQQQVAEAVAQQGRLDLLINNASILGPSPQPALVTYPLETLEQVFAVNTFAPLTLVQKLLPWLTKAQGLVVNLSSDAAVGGYAGWGGYGASKAALDLLSLTLANELRDQGVAVVPGEDISDRPLPETTVPFWAWLLAQKPLPISGRRFQAQAEVWSVKEIHHETR
jgi:NAD(P)-dependent dehydrogenase (short-subunit alcohol dehydrogenase family)